MLSDRLLVVTDESYSKDAGVSWTKARPMTKDRAGCVWPRLVTLGGGAAGGPAATLLSGGRICNEHISGLFLWANEGMARAPGVFCFVSVLFLRSSLVIISNLPPFLAISHEVMIK